MEYQVSKDGYLVSTDRDRLDVGAIHAFLSEQSYWAAGIPKERVATAIEHSLPFGLYQEERQIGFARAITDYATFAYLADVYVEEPYRERGLAKFLLDSVLRHPRLQSLRRWILGTADAHSLYEQFGFIPLEQPQRWMERPDPDTYTRPAEARA